MGTETYEKNGAVSQKDHQSGPRGKPKGDEHYLESRMQRPPSFGGAPEGFVRKYGNDYRKNRPEGESEGMGLPL